MTLALNFIKSLGFRKSAKPLQQRVSMLTKNPFFDRDGNGEDFLTRGALEIYKHIDKTTVENHRDVLRASAAPWCVRRRWLNARGIKGNAEAPRIMINFALGDIFEYVIKHLIKESCVGPGKLYKEVHFGEKVGEFPIRDMMIAVYKQTKVHVRIDPITVTGHPDGIGLRSADNKWEFIEAKSSSDFGFYKFQKNGPEGYLKQAHTLMMSEFAQAYGITDTRYFYGRKQYGHIYDSVFKFDQGIAETTKKEFLDSVGPKAPPPPYSLLNEFENGQPTGRKVAPKFPCTYCPYINTEHCHNGLTKLYKRDFYGIRKPYYAKEVSRG